MLQVTNIEKSYGKQVLFDGVSFTVNPRERVGLVGRNGHGKSTLFRMVLGEEHQDSGTITMPSGYTVGHLSQHIHFTEDTVIKEACLALPPNEDHIDETYKAEAILHGLGFTNDDFERHPSSLSGGYQVRLNLQRCSCRSRTCCSWTSPRTTWTSFRSAGSRNFCGPGGTR